MLFVYNSHYEAVNFTLPAVAEAVRWERLIDTNQPEAKGQDYAFGSVYVVLDDQCSLLDLRLRPDLKSLGWQPLVLKDKD